MRTASSIRVTPSAVNSPVNTGCEKEADALQVADTRSANETVDAVTLVEQVLGQVRAVLPVDSRDQGRLHSFSGLRAREYTVRVLRDLAGSLESGRGFTRPGDPGAARRS